MVRALAVVIALVACNKSNNPPLAPLPPDQPIAETTPDAAVEEPPVKQPPPRKVPTGPLEATLAATDTKIKLVNPGKGKRVPLKLTAKAGGKQEVEMALDFGVTQSAEISGQRESSLDVVPTVVLAGDAEVTTLDKGTATYVFTVKKTDARDVAGSKVPMSEFKPLLESVVGLTFGGTVGPNGATGPVTVKTEKQGALTAQVVELASVTMPPWPALPAEPVGVGAKWQATRALKLAGRLDVTLATDWELVSYKDATWTIKGTMKVTGADQIMQGGKITKITGTGTVEVTLVDGALYPSQKSSLDATFTASEPDAKPGTKPATLDFAIKIGCDITAK